MTTWTWDRVRRRLDEIEHVDALRATAVAMRGVLGQLAANSSLQSAPPYVHQGLLVFPGAFARSAVLHWNAQEGYQVSLAWLGEPLSVTRTVPVDQLAEVVLAYLERCRVPIPDATEADEECWGWNWERVDRRLTEAEQISLFRTAAAAMKRVLPRLRTELHALSPYVSHAWLMFPCVFRGSTILLQWNEEHGYQVVVNPFGTEPSETKVVPEGELAEEILSYLERCQVERRPSLKRSSPPSKTKRAKRRTPPKRPTPPSPPQTKQAKRRAPPKR